MREALVRAVTEPGVTAKIAEPNCDLQASLPEALPRLPAAEIVKWNGMMRASAVLAGR